MRGLGVPIRQIREFTSARGQSGRGEQPQIRPRHLERPLVHIGGDQPGDPLAMQHREHRQQISTAAQRIPHHRALLAAAQLDGPLKDLRRQPHRKGGKTGRRTQYRATGEIAVVGALDRESVRQPVSPLDIAKAPLPRANPGGGAFEWSPYSPDAADSPASAATGFSSSSATFFGFSRPTKVNLASSPAPSPSQPSTSTCTI